MTKTAQEVYAAISGAPNGKKINLRYLITSGNNVYLALVVVKVLFHAVVYHRLDSPLLLEKPLHELRWGDFKNPTNLAHRGTIYPVHKGPRTSESRIEEESLWDEVVDVDSDMTKGMAQCTGTRFSPIRRKNEKNG